MKFYTLKNTPVRSDDMICRESPTNKILGFVFHLTVCVSMVVAAVWDRNPFIGFVAVINSLLLIVIFKACRRVLNSQNWVVRYRPSGLLIKFRSYLHTKRSIDETVVVELEPGEIEWVGRSDDRIIHKGQHSRQVRMDPPGYLEIKLRANVDLTDLRRLIQEELQRCKNESYDYPVHVAPNGVIRIQWLTKAHWVTPGLKKTVSRLASLLRVPTKVAASPIIRNLTADPADARVCEDNILALAESGNRMAAIKLVHQYYGCSIKEATNFVDGLMAR